MQKPSEPNALTPPHLADPVHAVVPVARAEKWQAVRSDRQALLQRTRTVLEQRSAVVGDHRLKVRVVLTRLQRLTLQKWHRLIQDRDVTGRIDVVSGGVRQPNPIVGNARTNAGAG
jgi:broad specificity phosphatase PhoE